ncbi:hypothetical protein ED733_008734 [Metarhizium rileyi]|uniref:Uncharacterized protein n=1 Tax=Metarhizium rileyi (strain RCEF 4871) TaxID=1649241 RepID=A0A5C6GLU8_METRR|nr:hypothetical protein ED733_008734 [Metarhizium rileyi]
MVNTDNLSLRVDVEKIKDAAKSVSPGSSHVERLENLSLKEKMVSKHSSGEEGIFDKLSIESRNLFSSGKWPLYFCNQIGRSEIFRVVEQWYLEKRLGSIFKHDPRKRNSWVPAILDGADNMRRDSERSVHDILTLLDSLSEQPLAGQATELARKHLLREDGLHERTRFPFDSQLRYVQPLNHESCTQLKFEKECLRARQKEDQKLLKSMVKEWQAQSP